MHHAVALLLALAPVADGPVKQAIAAANDLIAYGDDLSSNSTWTHVAEGVESLAVCRAQTDAAVAAGTGWDQSVSLPGGGATTLRQVRKLCEEKQAKVDLLRAYLSVKDTWNALQLTKVKPNRSYKVEYALPDWSRKARVCSREVARALKDGNAPKTAFVHPDTTLGAAEAQLCKPLADAVVAARATVAHDTSGLVGDRAKIFEDEGLWVEQIYGGSRMPLTDRNTLAHASVWYVPLRDSNEHGSSAWIVRSFRFDGDKLVERKESHGDGDEPPDAAFP